MKKLFTVTITYEYAVLADTPMEAEGYATQAMRDGGLVQRVRARPTDARSWTDPPGSLIPPAGWDGNSLVFGAVGNVTFDQAAAVEIARRRESIQSHLRTGSR